MRRLPSNRIHNIVRSSVRVGRKKWAYRDRTANVLLEGRNLRSGNGLPTHGAGISDIGDSVRTDPQGAVRASTADCSSSECLDARAGIGLRATVSEPMTQALPRVPRGRQFTASIGRCRSHHQSCSSQDRFQGGRQQRSSLETSAKLPDPLSPPCGGRCHGVTEGGLR